MLIWTDKASRKYSKRTEAIWSQIAKWDILGRGFMILALVVGGITRPVFSHGDWLAIGIIAALIFNSFVCIGGAGWHCVRFLHSCAVDRRRRKTGLPLNDASELTEPTLRFNSQSTGPDGEHI